MGLSNQGSVDIRRLAAQPGHGKPLVDDLRWHATLSISYIVVRDSQFEAAAPVVRRLAGQC